MNVLLLVARVLVALALLLAVFGTWFTWHVILPEFSGINTSSMHRGEETHKEAQDVEDRRFARAGQTGDMYGSLNTLFTALAFLGVVYTIYMQRQQLDDARREAKHTRERDTIERFEGTFFQLLELLSGIVNQTEYEKTAFQNHNITRETITGRAAQKALVHQLLAGARGAAFEDLPTACENFFGKESTELDHYFRVLYRILRWIEHAGDVPAADKVFYAKILRAQLPTQELVLIFFNGLTDQGAEIQRFIYEFALLKHLPERLIGGKTRPMYLGAAYYDPEDYMLQPQVSTGSTL